MRFSTFVLATCTLLDRIHPSIASSLRDMYNSDKCKSKVRLTPAEESQHYDRFVQDLGKLAEDRSTEAVFQWSTPAIRHQIVDQIKAEPSVMWTASTSIERFQGSSLGDAKRQCGSILDSERKNQLPVVKYGEDDSEIPTSFDSRSAFGPECSSLIGTARDQSNCGSCWAFSTTTAMEDRVCLATKGAISKLRLSPLDTLSCCNTGEGCDSFGCNGGDPASAWEWFVERGVVTGGDYGDEESCKPYAFPSCAHHVEVPGLKPCTGNSEYETPECVAKCTSDKFTAHDYMSDKHKAVTAYTVANDEKSIKLEIIKNGPVSAAFMVYEDFLAYKSGIYHHVTGQAVGGHAVKMIGWGEENGVKYWLLLNSWNPSWGENGAFRMKLHEGGIMDEITAGQVLVKNFNQDDSVDVLVE